MRSNDKQKIRLARRSEALLRWLNADLKETERYLGKCTKASRGRVVSLLTEIKETQNLLAMSDAENPNFDFFDQDHPTITPRIAAIREMLQDYPKYPTAEISYFNHSAILSISDASGPGRALGEQTAVWDLCRLVETGQMDTLALCQCDRWFLKKRTDQKVCSPGCRHKTYEQTDSFKEKRRSYMKSYYALKQSGKVK